MQVNTVAPRAWELSLHRTDPFHILTFVVPPGGWDPDGSISLHLRTDSENVTLTFGNKRQLHLLCEAVHALIADSRDVMRPPRSKRWRDPQHARTRFLTDG